MSESVVYLAARYSRLRELQVYRDELRAAGFDVRARWVDGEHEMVDGVASPEQSCGFAMDDIEDLRAARIVINFTEHPGADGRQRGGRHVEFGYALTCLLDTGWIEPYRVLIVGPRENVFHYLPAVEQYDTWPECLAALQRTVVR